MPSSRDSSPAPGQQREQRLIVVSNRLPVTISKDDKGEYHFKVSLVLSTKPRAMPRIAPYNQTFTC